MKDLAIAETSLLSKECQEYDEEGDKGTREGRLGTQPTRDHQQRRTRRSGHNNFDAIQPTLSSTCDTSGARISETILRSEEFSRSSDGCPNSRKQSIMFISALAGIKGTESHRSKAVAA